MPKKSGSSLHAARHRLIFSGTGKSFVETDRGKLLLHLGRQQREINIWLEGIEPQSKKMSMEDRSRFQTRVREELESIKRRAFRGPIALQIDVATTSKSPPQVHTIAKNLLDLLGTYQTFTGQTRPLLYRDDSQIQTLSMSCRHGEERPHIYIRARPFRGLVKDLIIAGTVSRDRRMNDASEYMTDEQGHDSIQEFKKLIKNESKYRLEMGDDFYEASVKMLRWHAQHALLRYSSVDISMLSEIYRPEGLLRRALQPDFYLGFIKNSPVRFDVGELPTISGSSKAFEGKIDSAVTAFKKGWDWLINPLVVPAALEVVVQPRADTPPGILHDLDNIVRTYPRVATFAREWKANRLREQQMSGRGTFVPLAFEAGEAFQFDWSEDWAILGGEKTKLQVAHFKLSHSRAFIVRAYPLQTHEMLFDAHVEAFRVLGGVPRRGIYDNMRTAVDKVGAGKARQVNLRFQAMASHYLFDAEFCNPASGWEKGQVEKNVQDARHRLWVPIPSFPDLAALNAWLENRCMAYWQEIPHGELPGTIHDVWAEEQPYLMEPSRPFDGFVEHTKRVTPTCLVHMERNRYSVPASFANRPVSVRVYPTRIVVAAEGQILCEHERIINRSHSPGRTIYDWRHYLAVIQRKPGALRNGAPFLELPEAFRRLQHHLLKRLGGDREMVEILALVLQHDEQVVLQAVELALAGGVPTKTHILNLLHRLIDGTTPPDTIDAPQALRLTQEPIANVERYDALRAEARHAS